MHIVKKYNNQRLTNKIQSNKHSHTLTEHPLTHTHTHTARELDSNRQTT